MARNETTSEQHIEYRIRKMKEVDANQMET